MKRVLLIFILLLFSFLLKAQVTFKTIVPQQAVVVGESFQVQYIIEDAEKPGNLMPPNFKNFRFVTGPNTYTGTITTLNRNRQLKNAVYTLAAVKPGRFIIAGATAIINGKLIRSNDVVVEVISKEEAAGRFNKKMAESNSGYFLRTGEDAYEKIRKNIFLKVMVNRNTCFTGEPVVATFKLYSRLESKSDIIKNPGFYGFTVYDMVNLDDQQSATEIIGGKTFDVHTVRKVQLYPLQAGKFNIDAMEVKNKIEFSRSMVNKKTEQEITEGVLSNASDDETPDTNTEVFETSISTEPVAINVKPVPVKNKPVSFNGATGSFLIAATLAKNKLARNEEGILSVTISGRGNFTQLNAPLVEWPRDIEGFDPLVKDSLDKTQSPLYGSRTFNYAFVSAKPGAYQFPAVTFSFFDPATNNYKTISTPVLQFNISVEEKTSVTITENKTVVTQKKGHSYWWFGAGLLLALSGSFIFLLFHRKRRTEKKPDEKVVTKTVLLIEEILQPATFLLQADDKSFYTSLHQAAWKFFSYYLSLSGSEINKKNLFVKLKEKKIDPVLVDQVKSILQQCEAGMFTNANLMIDKNNLLRNTKHVLEEISRFLL